MSRKLNIKQVAVSRLEHRTDMYLSNPRTCIEALGGDLEIIARFPDHSVRIAQLEAIGPIDSSGDGGPSSARSRIVGTGR